MGDVPYRDSSWMSPNCKGGQSPFPRGHYTHRSRASLLQRRITAARATLRVCAAGAAR